MDKQKFCIANMKMYLNHSQVNVYLSKLKNIFDSIKSSTEIVLCPPYISLNSIQVFLEKNKELKKYISCGSQDISRFTENASTGNISLDMLDDLMCKYIIIGHSERRIKNNETLINIKEKFNIVYKSSICPILCIGESIEERKKNNVKEILELQIRSALEGHNELNKNIIIAYEPIWAIGTGLSADVDIVYATHNIIKDILKKYTLINCKIFLLYGGSVNEKNARSLANLNNVDGFLIGSASIDPVKFLKIYSQL